MGLSLLLCFASQRVILGCVASERGAQLDLLTPSGETLRIGGHQVLWRWTAEPSAGPVARAAPAPPSAPGPQGAAAPKGIAASMGIPAPRRPPPPPPPLDDRPALTAWLKAREAELVAEAKRLPLGEWVARLPIGEVLTLEQIAVACGVGEAGWAYGALCLALVEDRERFRRERGGFVALDPQERARREARAASVQAEREWLRLAEQWGGELQRGRWSGGAHPLAAEFLRAVLSLAAHERRSPHWGTLGKVLALHEPAGINLAQRLKPWLAKAGAWPGWPALWLERALVRQAFDAEVLDAAFRLSQSGPDPKGRVDRRGGPPGPEVYTVDAASTFDYDDAYSLEPGAGGALTVLVHIAEPSVELMPGHPVFDEAARRLSSVYTEEGIFPMLPAALSLGRCSLLRGAAREVVTFRFRVTEAGLEWQGLERALVEVRGNLDPEGAQRLIREQPATWGRLLAACEAQAQERVRRGAALPNRLEVRLDLSNPARIGLASYVRGGPAQRIVEELAIAYNRAAGEWLDGAALPALYRVQARPKEGGTGQMFHARFSTHPGPHEGLACPRYVQVTSPNRRFADLVMQRQIVAHALGRPAPFGKEQLAAWGRDVEARLSSYDEAERAIQEHWVRVYLSQNPGLQAAGTVRRVSETGTRVWLDELGLPAEADSGRALVAGQQRRFRITEVDVDAQRVRVAAL